MKKLILKLLFNPIIIFSIVFISSYLYDFELFAFLIAIYILISMVTFFIYPLLRLVFFELPIFNKKCPNCRSKQLSYSHHIDVTGPDTNKRTKSGRLDKRFNYKPPSSTRKYYLKCDSCSTSFYTLLMPSFTNEYGSTKYGLIRFLYHKILNIYNISDWLYYKLIETNFWGTLNKPMKYHMEKLEELLIKEYGTYDNIPDFRKKTLDPYKKEEFEKRNQY